MHRLREIQREFRNALLTQNAESNDRPSITHHIRDHNISSARRVQVYRNNIRTSLTGALQSIYPVVEKLVGDGFFKYAADEYIKLHPSRSGDIRLFGSEYPCFLSNFAPAHSLRYLPDVALLEWYYHEVFHGEDSTSLDTQQLGAINPEDYSSLYFTLHPATRLLKSSYPIFKIWRVNTWETEPEQIIELDAGGDNILVARDPISGDTELRSLPEADFELLSHLSRHGTLGDATNAALAADPGFDLSLFIAEYVRNQTLVGFSTT